MTPGPHGTTDGRCNWCGQIVNDPVRDAAPDLYAALQQLQQAVRDAHLLDVKKRYSLCVADAAASTALAKATGDQPCG